MPCYPTLLTTGSLFNLATTQHIVAWIPLAFFLFLFPSSICQLEEDEIKQRHEVRNSVFSNLYTAGSVQGNFLLLNDSTVAIN